MLGSRVRAPKGALKMEIRNGLHFFVHPSSEADIPYRNIFLSSTPSKRGSRRILHPVSPDIPISDGTFVIDNVFNRTVDIDFHVVLV